MRRIARSSLVGWEPFRASQFGIKHYCTIGLNSKEANNEPLAEAVMELLPLYLHKENVVGIGEIGYDDQTPAEDKYFRAQLELARELTLLADHGEAASRDDGCRVLYGIVRDCAYKIRASAERERDAHRVVGIWQCAEQR